VCLGPRDTCAKTQTEKSAAIKALVSPLRTPYPSPAPSGSELNPSSTHLLDLPHSTRTYKLLLSGGHFDTSTQKLSIPDPTLSTAFASAFWEAIISEDADGEKNARRIAKGNATFVMVEMVQALVAAGRREEVKRVLAGEQCILDIRNTERKGASLLADKLADL